MHNALAAVAAGLAAGMTLDEILPGLAVTTSAPHRSAIVRARGLTIVDDAYNASPGSMRAALDLLAGLPGRHVAVLGEMRELGDAHEAAHRDVGAAAVGLDLLVVVDGGPGGAAVGIADGALDAGMAPERILVASDAADAVRLVRAATAAGDVILVKASRGVELERVVDGLATAADDPGCPGGRGARVVTLELIQGLLLAFALVVILMPPYIRLLRHLGFAKQIREEGPQSHLVKSGTPTMGGLLVILVVLGIFLLLRWPIQGGIIAPLATLALVGLLGAADDYLNARTGEGIRARQKLLWQTVVALVVAFQIQTTYSITAIRVPFVGDVAIDPVVYIFFAAFAIVAASNGVNITDGLDGLAGGTLAFAFVSFMIIALLNVPAQPNTAFLCALIIGALLGFLWFNVHPAQVFMGDSGSLSLGAVLAVIALITGQILVLPIIGLIFVVETMSDIIQIGYFKAVARQARLPDGPAPPPLRARRLGRGEDHAPVLDRGHPRGPAGRHPVHGLDQCARLT